MRKYIIFLVLLSIVKNRAVVKNCKEIVTEDWYRSPICKGPDGITYKEHMQKQCWTCISVAREPSESTLIWGPEFARYKKKGYIDGKICPMLIISAPWYVWVPDTYPAKPMYAQRKFNTAAGYYDYETELQRLQRYGIPEFKTNPCSSMSSAAGDTSRFVSCIYTLKCRETHEKDPRFAISPPPPASGTVRAKAPPGHSSRTKRKVRPRVPPPPASGTVRVEPPPGHSSRRKKKAKPPHHSSALVDFDDMLHYYIGGISDYSNNEYTDYDGYDLDDQFEEMLTDVYMEGYKAGLNVERKWS